MINKLNNLNKKWFLIVLVIPLGISIYLFNNSMDVQQETMIVSEPNEVSKVDDNEADITIDIKGLVLNPGVYTLKPGSRVIDAIKQAGGLINDSDTSKLNLSQKLIDGSVIVINHQNDTANVSNIMTEYDIKNDMITELTDNNISKSSKININSATKDELMNLKGIGASKAQTIIDYRNSNGNFNSIEDLKKVKGIGTTTFEAIKDNITI